MGTVYKFNDAAVVSLLTSHLSICSSSLSWLLVTYLTKKNLNMADLLQGITTGLVGRFSPLGDGAYKVFYGETPPLTFCITFLMEKVPLLYTSY